MALGSGLVYSIFAPPEKVIEIAAHPSVQYLSLDGNPEQPSLDLALPAISFNPFQAKFPAGKQDGEGVLVGTIDTGIDGSTQHSMILLEIPVSSPFGSRTKAISGTPIRPQRNIRATPPIRTSIMAGSIPALTSPTPRMVLRSWTRHARRRYRSRCGSGPRQRKPLTRSASKAKSLQSARWHEPGNVEHALIYIFQKASSCRCHAWSTSTSKVRRSCPRWNRREPPCLRQNSAERGRSPAGRVLVAAAGNFRGSNTHVRREVKRGRSTVLRHMVNNRNDPTNPIW